MTRDLREQLQAALGNSYTLERELGGGGMSRVFVAQDTRLGRRVAIKVLRPDLAAGLSAARFEREIALAARLQHPHVVPLHASGDIDGLPYFTMPFVEGETLRERLRRDGALSLGDAVRLLREIASAMAYAHALGVVHRDLKPENVLLSGGHAVVADFGVAKALGSSTEGGTAPADAAQAATVTGLGLAVGTPAYMAPEQVAADPAMDHRADLYALGLIAYEVLAGTHPFAGRSRQEMLAAQLSETPPPIVARRPDVPPALDAVITRLLAKRREDRPQTAADVVRTLDTLTPLLPHTTPVADDAASVSPRAHRGPRRAVAVGAVVALVVAMASFWTRRSSDTLSGRTVGSAGAANASALVERRVAVAPFENQTGDSTLAPLGRLASDWIAQGLAEAALAEVVDPQTVRAAWREGADAAALGSATGARMVVSGAYSLEDDSVRIIARLTDAADGRVLQAIEPVTAPASRPQHAVALLRERVLGAVAGLLDVRTRPGAVVVSSRPPNLTAYRHWSAAMEHWFRNEFQEALPELAAAARADSTFAGPLLYAGVGHAILGETALADSLLEVAEQQRSRLTPTDRYLLDVWRSESRGDWGGALRAAREAARLSPGFTIGPVVTWWNAIRVNRPREALAALARTDPERPPMRQYAPLWEGLTQAHHQLGDYSAELAAAERGQALHPEHVPIFYSKARALAALGRVADAERAMNDALDIPPDPLHSPGEVTRALGRELRAHGHEAAAQAAFTRALAWYDSRPNAERATAAHRARRAEVLYAAGRWDEARQQFEVLAREHTGEVSSAGDHGTYGLAPLGELDYRGYLGALAARRGDRVAALAADSALAALDGTHLRGRHTYWRAAMRADVSRASRRVGLQRAARRAGVSGARPPEGLSADGVSPRAAQAIV